KYVYWPYDEGAFEATEELMFIREDPLELRNELNNPEHTSELDQMRKRYEAEVKSWKNKAVPYHNYAPFGELFDRD
ncbi:MAG: acetylglucosamine-6-sulfatase, partial [Verrucomicrobiota bacterium]